MKRATSWLVIILVLFLAVFVGWYNRFGIYDSYRLYNYNPPADISKLASEDTMTPYATHLFYVYHPTLENASAFNQDCKVTEAATVLGCTVINNGIYLFSVTDPELNGVEQVTAAHEMLHVAYSRLSPSEKKQVDAMVMNAFNQLVASHPLLKTEEQTYIKTEGQAAVVNEMHSILGTEVGNLPTDLENYYKKYFTQRQVIVSYANQYQSAFTQRQQIVAQDDQQLSTWQQQISGNESTLNNQNQQLQQEQARLNSLKASGQYSTYNAEVGSYNQQVNAYNTLLNQTRQLINEYNQLVQQRNAAALAENQLVQAISSLPSSLQTH